MKWKRSGWLLGLAVLALNLGCAGGNDSPLGDVISPDPDPTSNVAPVSLVVIPDPERTTCATSGRPCGCQAAWAWQTDSAGDSGSASRREGISIGLLPVGTTVQVEGTMQCIYDSSPQGPASWGGSVEIHIDGALVAADRCLTQVPQTGTATCTVRASHTVGS